MKAIVYHLKQETDRCVIIVTLLIWLCTISTLEAQVSPLNTLAGNDDYGVLRGMISQSGLENNASLTYAYRLHKNEKGFIQYFIGPHSFLIKSDLDIYNNIIYADFDNLGEIRPYTIEEGRVDSLHLILNRGEAPIAHYLYNAKENQYGLVIDRGRYSIVEGLSFQFRKGSFNPAIDSAPQPDKVTLKKSIFLVDEGVWYPIPKSKNDLLEFIRLHYQKRFDKSKFKGMKAVDVIVGLNG